MLGDPVIYIPRHLQGEPNSSSLQFEVAYGTSAPV